MASNFSALDYVILVVTLLGSLAVGLYFRFSGGRQKTNQEYLLADNSMTIFPVGVSLMSSFLTAVTLFGVSSDVTATGLIYILATFGYTMGVILASTFYLPVFYGIKNASSYEYLELRFGPKARLIASILFSLEQMFYNAIVLYTPAIVFQSMMGLNKFVSIVLTGAICIVYTTLGGIKAVIWTDLLQSLLMITSLCIVLVSTILKTGGWNQMMQIAEEGGRININNWNFNIFERHTIWSLCIGTTFLYTNQFGTNHIQVLRYKTLPTLAKARTAMFFSLPMVLFVVTTTCFCGLGLYAVYHQCDPLLNGDITSYNQLMTFFVTDALNNINGIAGLFAAGILNASLSTFSSACNALSAVLANDYIGKFYTVTPLMTKLCACFFGIIMTAMAFFAENLGSNLVSAVLTLTGALGGPVLGTFSLGIFTTYANENGIMVALPTGIALNAWMAYGQPRPSTQFLPQNIDGCNTTISTLNSLYTPRNTDEDYFFLYKISYLFLGPNGCLWVVIVGSIVSLLWKKKQPWEVKGDGTIDPKLFTPLLARRIKRSQAKSNQKPNKIKM